MNKKKSDAIKNVVIIISVIIISLLVIFKVYDLAKNYYYEKTHDAFNNTIMEKYIKDTIFNVTGDSVNVSVTGVEKAITKDSFGLDGTTFFSWTYDEGHNISLEITSEELYGNKKINMYYVTGKDKHIIDDKKIDLDQYLVGKELYNEEKHIKSILDSSIPGRYYFDYNIGPYPFNENDFEIVIQCDKAGEFFNLIDQLFESFPANKYYNKEGFEYFDGHTYHIYVVKNEASFNKYFTSNVLCDSSVTTDRFLRSCINQDYKDKSCLDYFDHYRLEDYEDHLRDFFENNVTSDVLEYEYHSNVNEATSLREFRRESYYSPLVYKNVFK